MRTLTRGSQQKANRATRQSWPVERKMEFVLQGLLGRRPITELCREAGVSPACYYQWRQQFINAARAGLTYPVSGHHRLEERIRQIEAENATLQQRVRLLQDLCVAD